MGRLLLVIAMVAVAYLAWNHVDLRSSGVRVDGSQVVVDADQLEATFTRLTPVSETFMLFGGIADRPQNSLGHVGLAGLPISDARMISASYPDFHRCKSPGAGAAQRLVKSRDYVAATGGVWGTLEDALDQFEEGLENDGERTCIRIDGAQLSLDSVRVKEGDMDITSQVAHRMKLEFHLAEEAVIVDCKTFLASAN